jgi:2-polyprenyl-3-methyl-5-hydroxy-6-metoxy-1,4-benzoquinol methylase
MDSSEWTGHVGDVWAEEWRRTDRSFEPVDAELIATAATRLAGVAEPRILDIGCGAVTSSLSLARRVPSA